MTLDVAARNSDIASGEDIAGDRSAAGPLDTDTDTKPNRGAATDAPVSRSERRAANDKGDDARDSFKFLAEDAQSGDEAAKDSLALATTGKTYDELVEEGEDVAGAFDDFVKDVASGKIRPNIVVAQRGPGVDAGERTSGTWLPANVNGAFVPGAAGTDDPGTILIAEGLSPAQLDETMLEEFGEALAEAAERGGVKVAEGDVGDRLARVVGVADGGAPLSKDDPLFSASKDDTATVILDGEEVEATAETATASSSAPLVTASFGTSEAVDVVMRVQRADGSYSDVTLLQRAKDGVPTATIQPILAEGESVVEIYIRTGSGVVRTAAEPGPDGAVPSTFEQQENGDWHQRFETGSEPKGDYNDVIIGYVAPGSPADTSKTYWAPRNELSQFDTWNVTDIGPANGAPRERYQLQIREDVVVESPAYDPSTDNPAVYSAASRGAWKNYSETTFVEGRDGTNALVVDNSTAGDGTLDIGMRLYDTQTGQFVAGTEMPGTTKVLMRADGTQTYVFNVTGNPSEKFDDYSAVVRPTDKKTPWPASRSVMTVDARASSGAGVPADVTLGDFPNVPLGELSATTPFETLFPSLPSDAKVQTITSGVQNSFKVALAESSAEYHIKVRQNKDTPKPKIAVLYDLLVSKSMIESGEYKGEAPKGTIDSLINDLIQDPDVLAAKAKIEDEFLSIEVGPNYKQVAANSVAQLQSAEFKTALLSMSREKREATVNSALQKISLLDPAQSQPALQAVTTDLYKGVPVERVLLEKSAMAKQAYNTEAAGGTPNAENAKAKEDVESAAPEAFDAGFTRGKLSIAGGNTAIASLSLWAKSNKKEAAGLLTAFTANMVNTPVNKPGQFRTAMRDALASQNTDAAVAADLETLMGLKGAETAFGALGTAFSLAAVGRDIYVIAKNGGQASAEERVDLAADLMSTVGGTSKLVKNIADMKSVNSTKSVLGQAQKYETRKTHFQANYESLQRASAEDTHATGLLEEFRAEKTAADDALADYVAKNPQAPQDPLPDPEYSALQRRVALADEGFAAASVEKAATGEALELATTETQTAFDAASWAQSQAKSLLVNDARFAGNPPVSLTETIAPVNVDPDLPDVMSLIDTTGPINPAAGEAAEVAVQASPGFARSGVATALRGVGAMADVAAVMYGALAIKNGIDLKAAGAEGLGDLSIVTGSFTIGAGGVGLAALGAEFAGFEAAGAFLGPVGLALGAVAFVGGAILFAKREDVARALAEKTWVDDSVATGLEAEKDVPAETKTPPPAGVVQTA